MENMHGEFLETSSEFAELELNPFFTKKRGREIIELLVEKGFLSAEEATAFRDYLEQSTISDDPNEEEYRPIKIDGQTILFRE
jgi:polyhydroxyalkanoate synthesis regulator phasin